MTELNTSIRTIYFVQMGDDGPIKIGITSNLKKRLLALQNASPYDLHVLYTIDMIADQAEIEEKYLHEFFKNIQLKGEWFRPVAFLVKRIEQMKTEGFYSIPEFNWSLDDYFVHNGIWYEISDYWTGLYKIAHKYKAEGDINSFKFIWYEVKDLLESL